MRSFPLICLLPELTDEQPISCFGWFSLAADCLIPGCAIQSAMSPVGRFSAAISTVDATPAPVMLCSLLLICCLVLSSVVSFVECHSALVHRRIAQFTRWRHRGFHHFGVRIGLVILCFEVVGCLPARRGEVDSSEREWRPATIQALPAPSLLPFYHLSSSKRPDASLSPSLSSL